MSSQVMEAVANATAKSNQGAESVQPHLQEAPSREVLRCCSCLLVQFRTASNHCRRCAAPLPRPEWELAKIETEAAARRAEAEPRDCVQIGENARQAHCVIGLRLKLLREARHMTQSEIAAKARVPRTYVSRIEHSHLTPGLLVVRRLAEALNVGVLDLFTDHDEAGSDDRCVSGDEYWNTFIGYFRALRPDQQETVLAAIRGMFRQRILQQRLSEYHGFSRRSIGFDRRAMDATPAF